MIRPMTMADVHVVSLIEQKVQTHPWTISQFEDAVKNYNATVIELNAQVVGFCILQTVLDEANLLLMAIDPSMQGRGLGYQLLSESIENLQNNPIQIFLEVRESNTGAIALYEKADFHQIDVRKNYYPKVEGGREHAIIMVKACSDNFSDLFK